MADEEQFASGQFLIEELGSIGGEDLDLKFLLDGLCAMCRLSQSKLANSVGTASIPDSDGIVFTQLCCCL